MPRITLLQASVFTFLALSGSHARASDVDLAGVFLAGSGVDTGDAPNNPYRLQLGGAAELTVNSLVLGVRGTRSVGSDSTCGTPCTKVKDLRSIGGDLGFDWELAFLHVGPRLGIGRLKERGGNIVSTYLEPGGVAELELAILTLGAELRYRFALGEPDVSGLLGYLRLGLRF